MAKSGAAKKAADAKTGSAHPDPARPEVGAGKGTEALDGLIHQKTRLAIVSGLAVNQTLTFTELRDLIRTTDGNLSVHTQKLEGAGYLHCDKSFEGRIPVTRFSLTTGGRKALERYLGHMEALIQATRSNQ